MDAGHTDDDVAYVSARRKRAFGFHLYETVDLTPEGVVKDVGLAVLVIRHGWGSKWSYLEGVGAEDVRRVAEWLQRVAAGSDVQPLDVGVDEETREPQITFEQVDPTTIRLRLRGEARPFHFLDEEETPDPPREAVVDFEELRPEDVRRAALFLRKNVQP
jgi:hypothetical protein